MILSVAALALLVAAGAQGEARAGALAGAVRTQEEPAPAAEGGAAGVQGEWLPSFTAVEVSGAFDITFEKVPDTQAPRIEYDTKGSYTTKFRFEVRDKVLHIRERMDSRRPERTSVRVRYNDLQKIDLAAAAAAFDGTLTAGVLDMTVSDGATVEAAVDVKDLQMYLSDQSKVTLTGTVRYLTLFASTGTFDAAGAECMAAQVTAQSKASVTLRVTDRLAARTSTGGTVRYAGKPQTVRVEDGIMAGKVEEIKE